MSISVDSHSYETSQLSDYSEMKFVTGLLEDELKKLEQEIIQRLQTDNPMISQIGSSIWNSGGKRIRPILVFLTSRLCDYYGPKDIDVAVAMEMVHVASLLHDDVIDGAMVRRGNPSANARWGNHIPILVGDFLYSWASRVLVKTEIPQALDEVANAIMDMTDGEISETLNQGDITLTEGEYLQIVTKKTASLFSSCCRMGAILGQKEGEFGDRLIQYGLNIGIAFQLIDDILDYTADEEKLGKPVGIDLKDGKMTLPMIHALSKGTDEERKKVEKIFSQDSPASGDLDCCIKLIHKYDSYNYTFQMAKEYTDQAKECLKIFNSSVFSDALHKISDYVISRSS